MQILVIDDEPNVLRGEERILRSCLTQAFPWGAIDNDLSQSAVQALQLAREKHYTLIFTDIEMPQMKGIALSRELEKSQPKANLFFVSGYSEYSLAAWDTCSCGYLLKPLTEQQVLSALNRVRYPLQPIKSEKLQVTCLGAFEVRCRGEYLAFSRKKSLEMLAVLVDRLGSDTSVEKIRVFLWDEEEDTYEKNAYVRQLARDIRKTLAAAGLQDVLINTVGGYRLNRDKLDCDYYDWLRQGNIGKPGTYMAQFEWAQEIS